MGNIKLNQNDLQAIQQILTTIFESNRQYDGFIEDAEDLLKIIPGRRPEAAEWVKRHITATVDLVNPYILQEYMLLSIGEEKIAESFERIPELAEKLDSTSWQIMLQLHMDFMLKFDKTADLEPADWAALITHYPEFAEKCNCWTDFSPCSLGDVLKAHPQFIDKFREFAPKDNDFYINLIQDLPELAKELINIEELTVAQWGKLLCFAPELAEKFTRWDELDKDSWFNLLHDYPEFIEKVIPPDQQPDMNKELDFWNRFSSRELAILSRVLPGFAEYFLPVEVMDPMDWAIVLLEHPEFASSCDCLEQALYCAKAEFIARQSVLADKIDLNKLRHDDWKYLLFKRVPIAEKCPDSVKNEIFSEYPLLKIYLENQA